MLGYSWQYCKWCGREIYQCPSHCRHAGWKHMDDGKHLCTVTRQVTRHRRTTFTLYAYPLTIQRAEQ